MIEISGDAWARRVFGEDGPRLRRLIPFLIRAAHQDMANSQEVSNLTNHRAYGNMTWRTYQEFATKIPQVISGAEAKSLPRAGYKIVKIHGIPIYPWRYAKDLTVAPETASLGNPPSDTRVALFTGKDLGDGQSSLFDDLDGGEYEHQVAVPEELEILADLGRDAPLVVVVQYASNPRNVVRIRWGDAKLNDDGTITSEFVEDLDLPGEDDDFDYGSGDMAVGDPWGPRGGKPSNPGGSFSDAPLTDPDIRLRDD